MDLAKIYKDKAYVENRWNEYLNYEKKIQTNISKNLFSPILIGMAFAFGLSISELIITSPTTG